MSARIKNWRFALVILAFIILVILISDFNARMADLHRLSAERDRVSAQLTQLVSTQYELETQVAYATSDAAVYKWAFETKRARPGDNLVVPIPQVEIAHEPTPSPVITQEVISNWQLWLSLFSDQQLP